MSTKIYHGFRFKGTDMLEAKNRFWKLRDDHLLPYATNSANKLLSMLETERKNRGEEKFSTFSFLTEEIRKIKLQHRSPFDVSWNVCLFPWTDGYTYGIPFSGRPATMHGMLMDNFEGYEEFGYWNNTDPPDDLSYDEFDARGQLWSDIFMGPIDGEYTAPVNAGFSLILIPEDYVLTLYRRSIDS